MTLPLTPSILTAAYEYLRATPPFRGWKLPEADGVEFAVTRHRDRAADHTTYCYTHDHVIRVSAYHIKTTNDLIEVVAHEMIHQHMTRTKTDTKQDHNRQFHRHAARVCKVHGWDVRTFV